MKKKHSLFRNLLCQLAVFVGIFFILSLPKQITYAFGEFQGGLDKPLTDYKEQSDQTIRNIDNMAEKLGSVKTPEEARAALEGSCDKKIGFWDTKRQLCVPKPVFATGEAGNEGICTSVGITGANKSGQVTCTQKLQAGPCELFELAIRAAERKNMGNVEGSSYTCQEFIDPVPAHAVKSTQNALCITMSSGYNADASAFANGKSQPFLDIQSATDESRYCHAIALKTSADFGIIFSLVGYFFFIVQPLLIAAGVGMIIYCGVQIMYGGGGTSEEAVKKVYKQLEQVLMGLALLFLIKLFLTTVNGLFFIT